MTRRSATLQCEVLAGLALLFSCLALADEELRTRVHSEYKHQSYLLIEDTSGARLLLFSSGDEPAQHLTIDPVDESFASAFERTRSLDPGTRALGLTELAGAADPEALNVALTLMADPSAAVRDEARQLIIDHPAGDALADALGLTDEDKDEEED
jgi:hypothetical protein